MSGDTERLFVQLEARIADFERRMRQAERSGTRTYNQLQRGSQTATRRMESDMTRATTRVNAALASTTAAVGTLNGALRTVGGPVIGAAAFAGLIRGARGAVSEMSNLGKAARDVGLDVEELQGLIRGFERETRISGDQATAAFERFNRRVGEAVRGAGPLNTTIERLGIQLRRSNGEMRTQGELLRVVADAIRNAGSEQERLAIAQAAFGDVGRQMAVALAEGGDAIDRMIREAEAAGHILDRDLIRRAEDLDDKFDDLRRTASTFFKRFTIEGAEAGRTILNLIRHIDSLGGRLEHPVFQTLPRLLGRVEYESVSEEVAALDQALFDVMDTLRRASELLDLQGATDGAEALAAMQAEVVELGRAFQAGEVEAEEVSTALERVATTAVEALQQMEGVDTASFDNAIAALGGLIAQLVAARAQAAALNAELDGESVPVQTPGPNTVRPRQRPIDWLPGDGARGSRGRGGGGGGGSRQGAFDAAAEAIMQRTAALEAEAVALVAAAQSGMEYGRAILFAYEKARLLNAAKQQGLTITPQLEARINDLAASYARSADEARNAAAELRQMEDDSRRGAEAMADLFEGMIQGGDAARRALAQLIAQIARIRLVKAFEMTPAAGWLGGLLRPFASGGYTGRGGKYEPAGVVHKGEYVMSADAVKAIGVDRLEWLHRSARGYAEGGLVGAPAAPAAPQRAEAGPGGDRGTNIKVVNVLDPGGVMEAGLSTTIGERAFFNFITRNSQAIRGALG